MTTPLDKILQDLLQERLPGAKISVKPIHEKWTVYPWPGVGEGYRRHTDIYYNISLEAFADYLANVVHDNHTHIPLGVVLYPQEPWTHRTYDIQCVMRRDIESDDE